MDETRRRLGLLLPELDLLEGYLKALKNSEGVYPIGVSRALNLLDSIYDEVKAIATKKRWSEDLDELY